MAPVQQRQESGDLNPTLNRLPLEKQREVADRLVRAEESDGHALRAAHAALEARSNVFEGEVIAERRAKAYEA